jgi:arginase family enzyme
VAVRVTLLPMSYVGERNVPEISRGPDYLAEGGIRKMLEERGAQVKVGAAIKLSPEEDKAYGAWNRLALANGELAQVVARERQAGLDPREVAGHLLTVPGGPTSLELAAALEEMFKYEKTSAFGVASTPYDDRDKNGVSRQAAYNLILGAVKGVQ